MSAKPPVLMLVKQPELFGVEHIGELYELRDRPGPGIAAAIAVRAQPFASEIGYFSRRARAEGMNHRYFATPLALAEWAEVMIVSVSGGSETAGLVDRAIIEALGSDGMLVNIARGSVVDQEAMVAALAVVALGCIARLVAGVVDPDSVAGGSV